jgi:hypothetical protein
VAACAIVAIMMVATIRTALDVKKVLMGSLRRSIRTGVDRRGLFHNGRKSAEAFAAIDRTQ